jgi:hypothetical protein
MIEVEGEANMSQNYDVAGNQENDGPWVVKHGVGI